MKKRTGILLLLLFTVKPGIGQKWVETAKVTPADRNEGDEFGLQVDISGDFAIASSHLNDYDGYGQNFLYQSGAAYILGKTSSGEWSIVKKLVAPDRNENDVFGLHVSIDGDFAVVGAYGHDFDGNGQLFKNAAGAAYVYKRQSNGEWEFFQKLVASDRDVGNWFGYGVKISGNQIFIAATKNSTDDKNENSVFEAGACYVFTLNSSGRWKQVQKIVASDRVIGNEFGNSIALANDYAVIGCTKDSYDEGQKNFKALAGSAYIFKKNDLGTWVQVQKIVAPDRQERARFGLVSIEYNTIAVSAYEETRDENGFYPLDTAGAVYIFQKDNEDIWTFTQKIVPYDRHAGDRFGLVCELHDGYAFIGAPFKDQVVNDSQVVTRAGCAYVYQQNNNGQWELVQKIQSHDGGEDDNFGRLAFSGNVVIAGARRQDTDKLGKNNLTNAGACYLFEIKDITPVLFYPNPTFGKVTFILNPDAGINEYTLYDETGKLIRTENCMDLIKLETSLPYAIGIYYFRFTTVSDDHFTFKVLKRKE